MPKETRVNKFSTNSSRSSPYPCSSNDLEFDNELGLPEDVKQWEEARCPICLDHPHNAVLLFCSSFENGCRPYVCNTSIRQSNCLDQFCKLPASSPSSMRLLEIPSATQRPRGGRALQRLARGHESELQPELHCPLCRGKIHGWSVVEAARKFMNSKSRNCSCETCDFVGNYAELRRHARSEHPSVQPSEADPERQQNWAQMERQRTILDLISMSFDHSQNNPEDEEDSEDLSIDGIDEEVFPSMDEGEEGEREERVDNLYSAYIRIMSSNVMGLSAPINIFTSTMNTANRDDNFRQNNRSRRNVSPAMSGRRDNPRYATLNPNDAVGSFNWRVHWVRRSGRAAVRRQPGTTIRQMPPRGPQFAH